MTKKKEIELSPKNEYSSKIDESKLKSILQNLQIEVKKTKERQEELDASFKEIIKQLMTPENIELKTEYTDKNENFTGMKFEFLSAFANMPQMKVFTNIFEKKRVSYKRKSRQEMVASMQQRHEETQIQKDKNISNFGY